jgi:cytochrome c oxidase subunit III
VRPASQAVPAPPPPLVSSPRLAMALFIAAETMLFGGMIGAFLVFRFGSKTWPPEGLPLLPIGLTTVNTLVLFASCVPMARAVAAMRRGDATGLRSGLLLAATLGVVFLAIQGTEWARLIGHGLTITSGPYGGTFYVLIGMHGIHVAGAVGWLVALLGGCVLGRFDGRTSVTVDLAGVYWYFVSALWAVLFPLVYLGLEPAP